MDATSGLCEGAWALLQRCSGLLQKQGPLMGVIPLLYLQQTVGQLEAHQVADVASMCMSGGRDGRAIARWLNDVAASLSLVLFLANECVLGGITDGFPYARIMLQRLEHKLRTLLDLLRRLKDAQEWSSILESWAPEELLSSGDFVVFWRTHFPRCLRASSRDFFDALHTSHDVEAEACHQILPWLQHDSTEEDELELADLALIFDNLGVSRGISFCTSWEDLLGHTFITAISSEHERGRRNIMSAADVVLARREQHSSVVLPGWSRDMLCKSRQCLQALMGLGVVVACDSKEGLVVQFEEAAAVTCLMVPPEQAHEGGEPARPSRMIGMPAGAKQLTQFGEALASMAQSDGSPGVSFASPGKTTALRCMSTQVFSHVNHPRDRHHVLIQYNARKLLVFADYLNVIDVLEARLRGGRKEHLQTCDPVLRSEAWPKLQQSLRNQKLLEEQVFQRKDQLLKMEQASDDPDQIAHIRLLLDDVAGAEEEQEQNRQWLAKQEPIWIEEEKGFQQARWRQDLVCRERLAAIMLELQYRLKQRGELHAELSRMEKLLLDFEETFSTTRQQLHEYDQELTAKIHDKEDLLLNLTQVLTSVKGQVLQSEGAAANKSGELECMHRIRELHASKAQLPDEIDMLEKKLAALRAKNGPAPNRA